MKKNILTMMAVVLLVAGMTACGGKDTYPFKDMADLYAELYQVYKSDPNVFDNKDKMESYEQKRKDLCKGLYGKSIEASVAEGLGIVLESDGAEIGEGEIHGDNIHIPMNFDLKITDTNVALENVENLMAILYDDEDNPVYIKTYIREALPLKAEDDLADMDTIAVVVDTMAVEDMPVEKANKDGQVLKKGISVDLEGLEILLLAKATKLVIEKCDYDKSSQIKEGMRTKLTAILSELDGKAADMKAGNAEKAELNQEESESETSEYTLENGKLGTIQVGKTIPQLPDALEGLYDQKTYKKIEHEGNDMDDPWTEEYYLFKKDGKDVFRVNISGDKTIYSIYLMEGSSFIKTPDGISVGYSVRDLFNKKRLEWDNYYDGTVFGFSGHYYYYVNADDLVQTDIPHKAEDFKSDAKVIGIAYIN